MDLSAPRNLPRLITRRLPWYFLPETLSLFANNNLPTWLYNILRNTTSGDMVAGRAIVLSRPDYELSHFTNNYRRAKIDPVASSGFVSHWTSSLREFAGVEYGYNIDSGGVIKYTNAQYGTVCIRPAIVVPSSTALVESGGYLYLSQ